MLLRRYHKTRVVEEPKKKVEEPKKSELPDYDELTKADIRKELDKREVEYNKRDNKDELYSLLTGSD